MKNLLKNKKIKRWLAILIPLLIVVELVVYLAIQINAPSNRGEQVILDDEGNPITITGENRKPDFFTFLVVGRDQLGSNTDTILVCAINMVDKQVSILSIPRDTMCNVSRYTKKINAAFAFGGVKNLRKEVSDLIGFDVDRHMIVDLDGFEKIIDIIGGVEMDVPHSLEYSDPGQNLTISIKAGQQVLNGKDAMGFVRFRQGYVDGKYVSDGDLWRVNAQQLFIKALYSQMASPANFFKIGPLANAVFDNIETDMTVGEMVWLATKMRGVSMENVSTDVLPGTPAMYGDLSYYFVSRDKTLQLINEKFNPYTRLIVNLNLSPIRAGEQPATPTPTPTPTPEYEDEPQTTKTPTPRATPQAEETPSALQTLPTSGNFNKATSTPVPTLPGGWGFEW